MQARRSGAGLSAPTGIPVIGRRRSGASFQGGGLRIYTQEVQQFFDRLLIYPSPARCTLYAALIDGLVADGVAAQLDAIYLSAAADNGTSLCNLEQAAYQAELFYVSADLTFTADSGFSGGGGGNQVNTTFDPSVGGSKFSRNNGMVFAYTPTTAHQNTPLFAQYNLTIGDPNTATQIGDNVGGTVIWSKFTDDKTYFNVNGTEITTAANAAPDASGLWLAQRTAANAVALYRNGSLLASGSGASAAPLSGTFGFACNPQLVRAAGFGASLTGGQIAALQSRLATYMAGL